MNAAQQHTIYREWLVLSMYDELGKTERDQLELHLESCSTCREEFAELRRLHSVLAESPAAEPAEPDLAEARRELNYSLRASRRRFGIIRGLGELFSGLSGPRLALGLGGTAILAAGILLGMFILRPETSDVAGRQALRTALPGETRITNVRFISTDPSTGEVDFTFDAVRPVQMRGNINDEQVQKVLTHALLTGENPGVRLQSVSTFASLPRTQDKEIKAALLTSLKTDENPGVRTGALKALRSYPFDEEVKGALLFVLTHDRNAGIRITAINYLDSIRTTGHRLDADVMNVFRDKMNTDDNNYIRLRARAVVEERPQ